MLQNAAGPANLRQDFQLRQAADRSFHRSCIIAGIKKPVDDHRPCKIEIQHYGCKRE
jgi:hypothetical protein